MNIDSFFIRIIFLALPGIIGARIYRKLTGRSNKIQWDFFIEIIIISVFSYMSLWLIIGMLGLVNIYHSQNSFLNSFIDQNIPLPAKEILFSFILAIIIAYILSGIYQFNIINRIGIWLGVTSKLNDDDAWTYFHKLDNVDWVYIRDHKLDLLYYGRIEYYSDSEKQRELVIRDVDVYSNSDGTLIYNTPVMYLSRDGYDLTIESIPLEIDGKNNNS